MTVVEAEGIVKRYSSSPGSQPTLGGISLQVRKGEMYGIIGPNGSGKSTLLRVLAGVEPVQSGRVLLHGKPLDAYSRRGIAKQMAVLEQDALPSLDYTVRQVLEMGRYPHQNWLGREKSDPEPLLQGLMTRLELRELKDRTVGELSGGERQRVALGKAMAQEPSILLLDEPTTFLDIGYQLMLMDEVRKWQQECGLTVISVLHDLNLAAQYCDRLLVLKDGMRAAEGTPWDVLTEDRVEQVYGVRPIVLRHPGSGVPQLLLQPGLTHTQISQLETSGLSVMNG